MKLERECMSILNQSSPAQNMEEIISFVGVRTHEKFYLQVVTRFENFPTRNLSENQPNPKPKSHLQFGEVDTKLVNNELHSLKTLKNLGGS